MKKQEQGFSLIELLIVVAIIGIIAAIAIPNLLAARRSANEAAAIGNLRTLVSSEATYQTTYGGNTIYGDPAALAANNLIDQTMGQATFTKSGYDYAFTVPAASAATSFSITAAPKNHGTITATGTRYFYTDNSGVIRANSTATAGSTDAPIQ